VVLSVTVPETGTAWARAPEKSSESTAAVQANLIDLMTMYVFLLMKSPDNLRGRVRAFSGCRALG
jgi:hypothetical protein